MDCGYLIRSVLVNVHVLVLALAQTHVDCLSVRVHGRAAKGPKSPHLVALSRVLSWRAELRCQIVHDNALVAQELGDGLELCELVWLSKYVQPARCGMCAVRGVYRFGAAWCCAVQCGAVRTMTHWAQGWFSGVHCLAT